MRNSLKTLFFTGGSAIRTYSLYFDDAADSLTVSQEAAIDNLPVGDMTLDFVLRETEDANANVIEKINDGTGWMLAWPGNGDLQITFTFTDDAGAGANYHLTRPYDAYNHYEVDWTASPRDIKFFQNGVLQTPFETFNLGSVTGTYGPDDANDIVMDDWHVDTRLRWLRLSNIARHSASFASPGLKFAPEADANTVLLLKLDEGTGTPVDSSSSSAVVAISGATWKRD